jgi:hypothetical protein
MVKSYCFSGLELAGGPIYQEEGTRSFYWNLKKVTKHSFISRLYQRVGESLPVTKGPGEKDRMTPSDRIMIRRGKKFLAGWGLILAIELTFLGYGLDKRYSGLKDILQNFRSDPGYFNKSLVGGLNKGMENSLLQIPQKSLR